MQYVRLATRPWGALSTEGVARRELKEPATKTNHTKVLHVALCALALFPELELT
jgi:hypothetical protein